MNNVVNQIPFLRTSREFPEDLHQLSMEINNAYLEIANAVNDRTISIFPVNRPANTGNSFFISKNQRQQSLRQVFTFTTTANIPHPLIFSQISSISAMYGQFYDGTNWNGLISGSSSATTIPGQISFYLSPNVGATPGNIIFRVDAAAPALVSGIIIIEWISLY